jgi:hypothetical protein
MSLGEDSGSALGYQTARGKDYPSIRQFTVFLENRVGQLLEVLRRFKGSRVRIIALNIHDSTECCIVRFVLTHPEQGREIFERAGLAMIESDLIALELPVEEDQPMLQVCAALLQGEINLVQTYPLMLPLTGRTAVALMVDNLDAAQETLAARGFKMLSEQELSEMG